MHAAVLAQNCPQNIGFEEGTFNNWEAFSGGITASGTIQLNPTAPVSGVHTLYKYSFPVVNDYYGEFPVNSPNGSNYTIMLGNGATGRGAERLTYTFTVPTNTSGYSFIYNYAVVFENPDHFDYEQPRFTAKVFDIAANQYVDCGSYEYAASSTLPGFKVSKYGRNVYYKSWTPVSINLGAYAGKQLRLEFTTNDCTRGGHFGYAYIDVDENCSSPIKGNAYCIGDEQLVLRAPEGFQEYTWYDETQTQVLGRSSRLIVSPAPPNGTKYALRVVPFEKANCANTLFTTVKAVSEEISLVTVPRIQACENMGADLTAAYVTQGSSAGLTFSYYADADATIPLPRDNVRQSGTYFIKAENLAGCYKIKPVEVFLFPPPQFAVKAVADLCSPAVYDLADAIVRGPNTDEISFTFWADKPTTIPLADPHKIDRAGTYYIKGSFGQCDNVVPVTLNVVPPPVLKLTAPPACPPVNLTLAAVYTGSTAGLTYTYWTDAAATVPLANPGSIAQSDTYYIKGTTAGGCSTIAPLYVEVNSPAALQITDPNAVVFPETVDLENSYIKIPGYTYTYWADSGTTQALTGYNAIGRSGTFFIKALSDKGCVLVVPVKVTINAPPDPEVVLSNTFSPNSDGINDLFRPVITGTAGLRFFKIFNRYGKAVYSSTSLSDAWNGTNNGEPVPTGTYFWIFEGVNTYNNRRLVKSGSVTVIR